MKTKSKIFVFLIIICILFSISGISASEIQEDTISIDNDYQSDIELNLDSDPQISGESLDDEISIDTEENLDSNLKSGEADGISTAVSNQQADSNNIEGDSEGESASFKQFHEDLNNSGEIFDLTHDYTYDENVDTDHEYIHIENLTINGNNHVIDGAGANFYFDFTSDKDWEQDPDDDEGDDGDEGGVNQDDGDFGGDDEEDGYIIIPINLVINDLTFKNFNNCPIVFSDGNVTFNNVNFTDCSVEDAALFATSTRQVNFILNNCNFYSNSVQGYFDMAASTITLNNTNFNGVGCNNSAILLNRGQLIIENSNFENFNAIHGSIINFKGDYFAVKNSKFLNSKANVTGGAILAKYFPISEEIDEVHKIYLPSDSIMIENCVFSNLSSVSNGGAIHIDLDSGSEHIPQSLIVIDSNFTDCSSKFGGAISILGGSLNISGSNFKNNYAGFEGGAIYSSWTKLNIANSNFENNNGSQNAGALFFDKGQLIINGSDFKNNKALKESNDTANAIYARDVEAYLCDSTFDNGGIAVYADFASNSKIENVDKNDDIFLMDNHNYILSVETPGIKLNFTNNEIIVDTLPSRFDARDWGWTTPGKVQGENDDCWAFATIASIETALLKATGVEYNLSQNYVQKLQLKYSETGDIRNSLTGFSYSGLGYALSWYGVLPTDAVYDDRGMIADTTMDVPRIHVQDAMIIYTGQEDTVDEIKRAIIKYGAVTVQYWIYGPYEDIPTEGDDISIMDHSTHFVTLIGWDENYHEDVDNSSDEDGGESEEEDNPYPKFAWITKDSLGGFGTAEYSNFSGIDYFAIAPQRAAIVYIFENNIDYHVNYQTDLTGLAGFDGNYTIYSNEFTSKYNELIGAVGTYFNESGINYSFDVFVNDQKVHTQTGISEFAGFRTIVLNKYIPIKAGDQFKVVFKSNAVPYQAWSRVHYLNGTSLVSVDGNSWIDFAPLNKTVCLKVYTVADDTKIINNKNIAVDYDGGSYFTVKVVTNDGRAVGSGEIVKFTINGKSTTVKTDNNGIAKIKIAQLPGKYTITTTYRGKTYKNTVTVKQVLKATQVSVKNTDKKLILKATLKINGKAAKGKVIKFTFRGKTYKAKTNSKGIAQVTVKQAVIKKLTGKSYAVKVTYLKDTVKTTVKVKQVLKAYKSTVKKTAKKFKLKASLKINGKVAKKKPIKFTFRGRTYKAKTNSKGMATVTIKEAVIKKLKKGKTYAVKVAYGKDYLKTTVKVKK